MISMRLTLFILAAAHLAPAVVGAALLMMER